jgi:sulfite reductase beta subunit-like hemoprotein
MTERSDSRTVPPEPTWELVRKRNNVERLKHEKHPLQVIHDIPRFIEGGYEEVAEEDIVRLQWYGLYHDKPKTGTFMLRVKIPNGILTPHQLRIIGQLSVKYGQNFGELTTRQNIQLHSIELSHLPDLFATLTSAGLPTVGGCGDTVRNITGCPVAGIDPDEPFDALPVVEEAATFFYGNPDYSDLPRKHKITIASCVHQCNAPEINCISLVGVVQEGQAGFAVKIGGGLSTWPKFADDLGVFIPVADVIPVLRAIIDVWKTDLKYRTSRVKARLKFMVHDVGPAQYRQRVEEKLGYRLADGQVPLAPEIEHDHIGIHRQKQKGLFYVGFPVYLGLCNGEQMQQIADIADSYGGDIRLTRRQNFILTDIPHARLKEVLAAVAKVGFPVTVNPIRASSIACTGEPFCNYSVAETKSKLSEIVEHLEGVFGEQVAGLRLNLDGCPHACAHHWIGDIGLQGTTLRERGAGGERLRGYEIYLRGGLGRHAAIGKAVVRRVPSEVAHQYVERLVGAYLSHHQETETMQAFFTRHSDEELVAIATGENA